MQTLSLIPNPEMDILAPPPFYRWENWGKESEATCPGSTVGGMAQDSFTGWLLSSIPKAPATLWGLAMGLDFRNCFLVLWNKNTFFSLRTCSPMVPDCSHWEKEDDIWMWRSDKVKLRSGNIVYFGTQRIYWTVGIYEQAGPWKSLVCQSG